MNILEYFLNLKPKNELFYPRKLRLPKKESFYLYGARATGKSTLILEYLNQQEELKWLYIDAQDPNFVLEDIDVVELEIFLKEESINTLVIDHWYPTFLERLPKSNQLIIVSRQSYDYLKASQYELFPLDYEEFLGFDRTHSPTLAFKHFLKLGTLPTLAKSTSNSVSLQLRRVFYEYFDENQSRLLIILARFQGRRVSVHQIYTTAREYFKISKDWLYSTIKDFEKEKIIFFITYNERGTGKKLILYDFVLTQYLNKHQPFFISFDSMVALTLIKHSFNFKVIGGMGYYIPNRYEIVIPSAFENEEQFWIKAQKHYREFKRAKVSKVWVVTVSNIYSFTIDDIYFEAIPFFEWSIVNED